MYIDTVIAEAVQEAAEVQKAAPEAAEVVETPEVQTEEVVTEETKAEEPELTPEQLEKKERNRISKLNSKLAEMKRRNRELEALVGQKKEPQAQPVEESKAKTEDDFETWGEWQDYLIEQKLQSKMEAKEKQTQQTQQAQVFENWKEERSQHIDKRVEELAAVIPDFTQSLEEIEDSIPAISPEMGRVILEADDINLAAYALKKEGGIEAVLKVLQMSPLKAAAEIAKAEVRGQAYLKQPKPVTSAPAPLTPARGNAVSGTPVDKLDGLELLRAIRK